MNINNWDVVHAASAESLNAEIVDAELCDVLIMYTNIEE